MLLKQVNFKKPDIEALNKEGFLCVDMHCHTDFSDGAPLKDMLEKAKEKGLGLAITDHNEIQGALEAMKQNDVFIVPGIEINSEDGPHILCYFYDASELERFYKNEVEKYKTTIKRKRLFPKFRIITRKSFDIIKAAKNYNCLVSLAHPYGFLHMNIEKALFNDHRTRELVENTDAIEVIVSNQRKNSNIKSYALKLLFDKCATAGSDAHSPEDLGGAVSCTKATDVEDFLNNVKLKRSIIVGKASIRKKVIYAKGLVKKGGSLIKKSLLKKIRSIV